MKVEFKKSFAKDLERVKEQDLKRRVRGIVERVEQAQRLQEVENLKVNNALNVFQGGQATLSTNGPTASRKTNSLAR